MTLLLPSATEKLIGGQSSLLLLIRRWSWMDRWWMEAIIYIWNCREAWRRFAGKLMCCFIAGRTFFLMWCLQLLVRTLGTPYMECCRFIILNAPSGPTLSHLIASVGSSFYESFLSSFYISLYQRGVTLAWWCHFCQGLLLLLHFYNDWVKCVHERRDTCGNLWLPCLGSSSAPHLTVRTLLGCRLLSGHKKMLKISLWSRIDSDHVAGTQHSILKAFLLHKRLYKPPQCCTRWKEGP